MTDEIIEQSLRDMPPEVYDISGPEILEKLKSRRDQLPHVADRYYEVLARKVNVYGSNKHEYVQVERLDNKETRVRVYKRKKDGEVLAQIYDRTFYTWETKEIR